MKTPKEKAIELIEKFDNGMEFSTPQRFAKICTLIAVDRNIEMLTEFLSEMDGYMHEAKCAISELIEYEKEIKQEIEKL